MSLAYNNYLDDHIANVQKAYWWIKTNMPEVVEDISYAEELEIFREHDVSKYDNEEYDTYDDYFYGTGKTHEVKEAFNYAWLHHIHNSPHHWQHWILINDEPNKGIVTLDMPYHYIVEMVCDWWSFSWKTGNLYEIFKWYDEHKNHMKLSDKTRKTVEYILGKIYKKLKELEEGEE